MIIVIVPKLFASHSSLPSACFLTRLSYHCCPGCTTVSSNDDDELMMVIIGDDGDVNEDGDDGDEEDTNQTGLIVFCTGQLTSLWLLPVPVNLFCLLQSASPIYLFTTP